MDTTQAVLCEATVKTIKASLRTFKTVVADVKGFRGGTRPGQTIRIIDYRKRGGVLEGKALSTGQWHNVTNARLG